MNRVLERLLNLLAFLRTVGRPVTIDEIRFTVAGYDRDNDQAFRRMFERDKSLLRGAGLPLDTVVIDEITQQLGYELAAERFEMVDPGLDEEERAALWLAARMVRLGGTDIGPAFHKLGGEGEREPAAGPLANLGGEAESMAELFDAITSRRRVAVTYRDQPRVLEPLGLLHRRGHWYLVANAHGERRVFRVDRATDWAATGEPDAFTPPADLDLAAALPEAPWEAGDERVTARVRFDDDVAWWVRRQLPGIDFESVDGGAVASLDVASRDAFMGWLLDLGPSAEVLGPPELRAEVVARIEGRS
jgi:proteasome accessory factor B